MSVAKAYANALYQSAIASGVPDTEIEKLEQELAGFVRILNESKEARVSLLGFIVPRKERTLILSEIAKKSGISKALTNFLLLLAKKGRLKLLPQVLEAFGTTRLEAGGGVVGTLVSADSVESGDLEALRNAFARKFGKKVSFRTAVEPSLLAGVKITVNGVTYDGTLRSQLQRLRDRLVYGSDKAH